MIGIGKEAFELEKKKSLFSCMYIIVLCQINITFFFASSLGKSINIYKVARMGQNFDNYPFL